MSQPSDFDLARVLWNYQRLEHPLEKSDFIVGLGSHDPGVPVHCAELWRDGWAPEVFFTGANAPTTVQRFPDGEAEHYLRIAVEHGIPADMITKETRATNTGENAAFTRELLEPRGVQSIVLVARPYQLRRAYATFGKSWPEIQIRCSGQQLDLEEYMQQIQDDDRVINMLVGDTQRIWVYAKRGFALAQEVPMEARAAYGHLVARGYTRRLIPHK